MSILSRTSPASTRPEPSAVAEVPWKTNPSQYEFEVLRDILTLMRRMSVAGPPVSIEIRKPQMACEELYDWSNNREHVCGPSELSRGMRKGYEAAEVAMRDETVGEAVASSNSSGKEPAVQQDTEKKPPVAMAPTGISTGLPAASSEVGCGPCGVGPDEAMAHEELMKFTNKIITDSVRDEMRKLNNDETFVNDGPESDAIHAVGPPISCDEAVRRFTEGNTLAVAVQLSDVASSQDFRSMYITLWRRVVQAAGVGNSETLPLERAIQEVDQWSRERKQLKKSIQREIDTGKQWMDRSDRIEREFDDYLKSLAESVGVDMEEFAKPSEHGNNRLRWAILIAEKMKFSASQPAMRPPITGEWLCDAVRLFFPATPIWSRINHDVQESWNALAAHIWPHPQPAPAVGQYWILPDVPDGKWIARISKIADAEIETESIHDHKVIRHIFSSSDWHENLARGSRMVLDTPQPAPDPREDLRAKIVRTSRQYFTVYQLGTRHACRVPGDGGWEFIADDGSRHKCDEGGDLVWCPDDAQVAAEGWLIDQTIKESSVTQ